MDALRADELPPGRACSLEVAGRAVLVGNVGGELCAIADLCSHDRLPIGPGRIRGGAVQCPRHGARFDIRTGEVVEGPALLDVERFPVRVVDGEIVVDVD